MTINLGERFRLLRTKAGFTQTQVARYLEVDQSYISKFEKGDRQLGMHQLNDACVLFGCSMETMNDPNFCIETLPVAARTDGVSDDDLKIIAVINKLALNQQFMETLLEDNTNER